eukprot:gene5109-8707_t
MEEENQPEKKSKKQPCKLVLLGQAAVGKSSVVLRYVEEKYRENNESTMGASYLTKSIVLEDKTKIQISIWDTAGQERYKSLAPMYYRDANCALVVFDLCDYDSFKTAQQWVRDLKRDCVKALVGNKLDLARDENQRKVQTKEAQNFALEQTLIYAEVSAKLDENIDDTFLKITQQFHKERVEKSEQDRNTGDLIMLTSNGEEVENKKVNEKTTCCG